MILDKLNEQQKKAVMHDNGPLAIIASAGSGKTRVITHKIAYLIEEKQYKPYRILAVTFTNKAAKEMQNRVIDMIGPENGEQVKLFTYHSLCARILREEISQLDGFTSNFNILDPADQRQILAGIYKKLAISPKTHTYGALIEFISHAKSDQIEPETFIKNAKTDTERLFAQIYRDYVLETNRLKSLDFDDLLLFVNKIFKQHPEVAQKWANKFDYVMVDEFQDTSYVQYEIIRALVRSNNLTIVGDPDQTIYTWRRADVSLINNFQTHFPNATIIKLEQNYRSTKTILDKANSLIKHNTNRIEKNLVATREEGTPVEFFHAFSDDAEARWIAQKIQELKRSKNQLKEIAILYRANYLSGPIENALMRENINYVIWGGTRFYQREEIKDAISFLKIINDGDETSLKRLINVPARKIGQVAQEAIFDHAEKLGIPLWELITKQINALPISHVQKLSLATFINLVNKYRAALKKYEFGIVLEKFLFEVGYMDTMNPVEEISRIENIRELIKNLKDWAVENPAKTLHDYLEEISLNFEVKENNMADRVALMTVHTSKGAEFDNVFIAGFSDAIFPSARAVEEDKKTGLEEERRLAYVAITRAKDKLFISDSKGYSIDFKLQKRPSRFLKEMGIRIEDFAKDYIDFEAIENAKKPDVLFAIGDKVKHSNFGEGSVENVTDNFIWIKFTKTNRVQMMSKKDKSIEKLGVE